MSHRAADLHFSGKSIFGRSPFDAARRDGRAGMPTCNKRRLSFISPPGHALAVITRHHVSLPVSRPYAPSRGQQTPGRRKCSRQLRQHINSPRVDTLPDADASRRLRLEPLRSSHFAAFFTRRRLRSATDGMAGFIRADIFDRRQSAASTRPGMWRGRTFFGGRRARILPLMSGRISADARRSMPEGALPFRAARPALRFQAPARGPLHAIKSTRGDCRHR